MKRQLTADQMAKRDERRASFRLLVKQVAKMGAVEKAEMGRRYGARSLNGGEYSLCNQILLALQLPEATLIGGFRQWLKAGRCVRKGEHGAAIWVPTGGKQQKDTTTGANLTDTAGDKPGFICGAVFDISQTSELHGESGRVDVLAGMECAA